MHELTISNERLKAQISERMVNNVSEFYLIMIWFNFF